MSLKNEPVSVEIESCAPSYEQGTPVGLSDKGGGRYLQKAMHHRGYPSEQHSGEGAAPPQIRGFNFQSTHFAEPRLMQAEEGGVSPYCLAPQGLQVMRFSEILQQVMRKSHSLKGRRRRRLEVMQRCEGMGYIIG